MKLNRNMLSVAFAFTLGLSGACQQSRQGLPTSNKSDSNSDSQVGNTQNQPVVKGPALRATDLSGAWTSTCFPVVQGDTYATIAGVPAGEAYEQVTYTFSSGQLVTKAAFYANNTCSSPYVNAQQASSDVEFKSVLTIGDSIDQASTTVLESVTPEQDSFRVTFLVRINQGALFMAIVTSTEAEALSVLEEAIQTPNAGFYK